MTELDIHPLAENDLDALLALYAELNPGDAPLPVREEVEAVWRSIRDDKKLRILGGYLGKTLVCTCILAVIPNLTRGARPYALIENVVTTANQRGNGYARSLLNHACDMAWQLGCYKVMLMTGRKDEKTLSFYEAAGFDRDAKQAFYVPAPSAP
ncbi:GNAT family N-acetyltransferase [Uliginosibacterium gangwonense]|uniref:GNAT family N-acetyltransferase n=1 Tax=Uliginosibacterium gangwonense TaxID=392736 RepID=UPI000360EB1A|nr:GNAT family N-acetyltransferase [Uliginosibacterium gangwonense]